MALLTKNEPLAVRKGFPTDDDDAQRRIIMADIQTDRGPLTVVNGYFPQGESRDHPTKFPAKENFIKIYKITSHQHKRQSHSCSLWVT